MRIPVATYRIQFNPEFGFQQAQEIVSYLAELGISDFYASPIFRAQAGSMHGYDVVDPCQLNPELGSEEEFEQLISQLQENGMGWFQDIVPNHMALSGQNSWLMDVLANGSDSDYFEFFDIDWEHPDTELTGRVLVPTLGDFYSRCLENGEIQLSYDETGLWVNYYELELPIRIESYPQFFTYDLGRLTREIGRSHPDFIKILGVLYLLKNLPEETSAQQRRDQAEFAQSILWELYKNNSNIAQFIEGNLEAFNGVKGDPSSFDLLDSLLLKQFFRLAFWKVGAEEIDYRRFFTINQLIGVRVEDLRVFNRTHELIAELVESGKITGLRIDHIDGLYNPAEYLARLHEKLGDIYITAEKILEFDEPLPQDWSVEGTSGYDFLSWANGVFCYTEHQRQFSNIYFRFTGYSNEYEQLFVEKKRLIADTNLAGDAENLALLLKQIAGRYRYGRDFTLSGLKRAILEVLVSFPVYRTYINHADRVTERDRVYIGEAIAKAKAQIPQLLEELNLIEKFLLLQYDDYVNEEEKQTWLHFVMKFQQFSSPLMAKGIEDTLFYVYNRLISLNEVGSTPHHFGISVKTFHQLVQQRQKNWPHGQNATSTHDTKRSEDVRARINVLSEIPDRWEEEALSWIELNRQHKTFADTRIIPDTNDEYFLYQNLIGAFPFKEEEYSQFVQRIKDFVVKAVREAKVHTAWLRPDEEYENGFMQFVDKILEPGEENQFLEKLRGFQQEIAFYGIFNSLSQTLLKLTVPGVPDFYQGTELWDLSLVDPDNRRPVDYSKRQALLQDIRDRSQSDLPGLLRELLANKADGRIKLFLIARLLEIRKAYLSIFQTGDYLPIKAAGMYQDSVIAFTRSDRSGTILAIAPRFLTGMVEPGVDPLGEVWQDTTIQVPMGSNVNWHDAISDREISGSDIMSVAPIFEQFPIALLVSSTPLQS